MEKLISAADANRKFSELLRLVREGDTFVVTSHGRPVAKIVPVENPEKVPGAKERLLARLSSQPAMNIGKWTREELYED